MYFHQIPPLTNEFIEVKYNNQGSQSLSSHPDLNPKDSRNVAPWNVRVFLFKATVKIKAICYFPLLILFPQDAQPRQMLAFPRPLIQDQQEIPFPERLSYSPQRPLPTVPSTQAGRGNPWMNEIPSADYDQQNPFEALPMRQLLKPKASTLPLPDYGENSSQPMNDLITNMPSRFVRPQYTYN
ncbi:Mep1b: Meprin A subunit beta [Crotalus adamanteus]|uniref:Mep1b: Meprin A subunit beta n=1 Tax=Crotalus adamanteus TaxID=8729 RepID=A0AAW1AUW7_CROAD